MRDAKRLAAVRSLPCVKCGHPYSQAAHSNWLEHGCYLNTPDELMYAWEMKSL